MFDSLATAIRELEVPVDAGALRSLVALHDRLTARLTEAIGEFDEAGVFDTDGAASMKMWLVDEGLAPQDAHRQVAWARRLRDLRVVCRAWQVGDLAVGQVRAIVEAVIDRHVSKFQAVEDVVVPLLAGLSVKQTAEVMGEWRARADALDDTKPPDPELSLHHSQTLGGRYITSGSFDAGNGSVIAQALAIADSNDLAVAADRRRAEAAVTVHQFFLDHHQTTVPPRQRPHVSIVINTEDLAAHMGGRNPYTGDHYDAATVSRYLCDCSLERIVADKIGGAVARVLDMGRSARTATPAQRVALAVRDGGCRLPSCTVPAAWCEAHHVVWFEHGGPTDMDNLALLCGRHHDEVHRKPGMHLKLHADATLEVTYPNGTTRTTRPPGALDPLPLAS